VTPFLLTRPRWLARLCRILAALLIALPLTATCSQAAIAADPAVMDLGDRLELFVDRQGIESLKNARLVLHRPRPAEVALKLDAPWEGPYSAYFTVFQDADRVRMYYRGWTSTRNDDSVVCYAESTDGIHWNRPNLGLFEHQGSKQNSIAWKAAGYSTHNFTPFKDTRPGVSADEQYKALGGLTGRTVKGLFAYVSHDGLHWRSWRDEPVLTKGVFDSQNLAFWDPNRQQYACYFRIFTDRVRAIAVSTSDDFQNWSDPAPIELGDTPREHFYTNATTPYFRAPHYYFAFPKRYVPDRHRLDGHKEQGISDGVFLSSRDGLHFDRTFLEAFIRPGRDELNWGDRSNMTAWGLVQTGPDEMSVYYSQHYRYPSHHLRRGVLRLDGIASAAAGAEPGEVLSKPLRFAGKRLILNYSTSAAGSVRVEIQNADGQPLPGYELENAPELYGDQIAEAYSWKAGPDVSQLAGQTVRLRFVLKDADLYSYRFGE
jgi:hypothetical protein